MEIEGFDNIASSLSLVKKLHDIGRFDIIENHFDDVLCYDTYYHNVYGTIFSIFQNHESHYDESEEIEIMSFQDDVISGFFVHAWEYGKRHNLHYSQNPFISQARKETRSLFNVGCCVDSKLAAYIRTEKAAKKSKLFVRLYNGCGNCNYHENTAYGLIKMYLWFKNKCAEFEVLKAERQEVIDA